MRISWASVIGRMYQVEMARAPGEPFVPLGDPQTAQLATMVFECPPPATAGALLRVRIDPARR